MNFSFFITAILFIAFDVIFGFGMIAAVMSSESYLTMILGTSAIMLISLSLFEFLKPVVIRLLW